MHVLDNFVCGRVPWLYQYWSGGFMVFVVLCPGTPEGSTGSGSGFKASQKTGQRLKVSSIIDHFGLRKENKQLISRMTQNKMME